MGRGAVSLLLAFAAQCLHILLMLAAAPTAAGILGWGEARLAGRAGVSWREPWLELVRLRRKQPVQAESASAVFTSAPVLSFAALAAAAALVPSFALGMSLAPFSDLLVIGGLLALARVVLTLGMLDEGSAPGGTAARQAMILALYGEATLLLAVLALGLACGTTNLDLIAGLTRAGMLQPPAAAALIAASLVTLTVVHREAGMPEAACFSAADLALLRVAEALRLLVWIDLVGAVFVPFGLLPAQDFPTGWLLGTFGWAVRLLVALGLLAGLRVATGRLAPRRIPLLLSTTVMLTVLATLLVLTWARPV